MILPYYIDIILKSLVMKKISFLLIPFMLIGLVESSSAQNCEAINLKINLKDAVFNDGLYYYNNQLFTGSFYNLYSTSGPINTDLNGFAEGTVLNGEREGIWQWYENNNLKREAVYENGINSKGFVFINGDKYTVLN